jgi:hypothetical protein
MWFLQLLGRILRRIDENDRMTAVMYLPKITTLVSIAERIQEEIAIAMREEEPRDPRDPRKPWDPPLFDNTAMALDSIDARFTDAIINGEAVNELELLRAEQLRLSNHIYAGLDVGIIAMILRDAQRPQSQDAAPVAVHRVDIETPHENRTRLRAEVKRLVGWYCSKTDSDYKDVNKELIKRCPNADGKTVSIGDADLHSLENRLRIMTEKVQIMQENDR